MHRPNLLAFAPVLARTRTLTLALVAGSLAPAIATAFEVVTLDNGLTVLLEPDDAHDVIAAELYVTTGNRTEDEYYQGSLHYIEHLVFKGGTQNLAPTEFRKKMSLLGRESGGWTWNDEINFGFEVPKAAFPEAISTFQEALTELRFELEWFEDEKDVVLQEMEKRMEQPTNRLFLAWAELAFAHHPYGRPVIGSEKAIRELEMNATYGYYRERFTPNHMILSIAGDFRRDEMLAWIAGTFGALERGPDSFELGIEEPEQLGPRTRVEHLEESTSSLHLIGARTPGGDHADIPALVLLGEILSSASFGLPQYLVEQKKWVTSVSARQYTMRDHGTFTVLASMPPENAAAVEAFIRDFLLDFDVTEVPRAAFEEIRHALLAEEARDRETFVDRAGRNGFLASRLGVEGARTYVDRLAVLVPEDVQAAKARHVTSRKLVTASAHPADFVPKPPTERVEPAAPALGDPPDLDVAGALSSPDLAPLSYRQTIRADLVSGYSYDNGLRVLVRPVEGSRVLAISVRVLGGQWVEPIGKEGLNRFVAEMGLRETRRWGPEGFERLLGSLAVEASAHASVGSRANTSRHVDYRDAAAHHYRGLSSQVHELLTIAKETVFFPRFDPEEVEKLRLDLLEEARRLPENNLEYIKQSFYERAFAGHPYGRPTGGTQTSLASIDAGDLERHHAETWTPDRAVVAVVGDVNPNAVAAWIATHWADLPRKNAGEVPLENGGGWEPPAELVVLPLGKEQWTVNWGRPGVTFDDPRQFASRVLSSMAGNDHFYRYVYEEGVSYRSWIRFWPTRGPGAWILENDVQRERFDDVLTLFERDLARYAAGGFTEKEFEDAIQRLTNSHVLDMQRNSRLAWEIAVAESNGAGFRMATRAADRYRQVTYEDVIELAREVFRPDAFLRLAQK